MHWYGITDEIVYVPGTKVKGETTYKAGFYDLPVGTANARLCACRVWT